MPPPRWGMLTADVEDVLREELGDARIQVLQCGPAAERGVLYGALVNNANRVNGRGGMGTVMASKNLKAVAVRGHARPEAGRSGQALRELARWGAQNVDASGVAGFKRLGTAALVTWPVHRSAACPRATGPAAPLRAPRPSAGSGCRRRSSRIPIPAMAAWCAASASSRSPRATFPVDPRYGGPEYESIATLGSYCGVSDLAAVARANQLCNVYGMDTIACGATIAWAMDCFEHGLLTTEDTGGIELRFGDADAMVEMAEMIGEREGFGKILGEGSARAAEDLGVGQDLVVAVKGRELPAHMPQVKREMALLYAVNPGGADHTVSEHGTSYTRFADGVAALGLLDPQPPNVTDARDGALCRLFAAD